MDLQCPSLDHMRFSIGYICPLLDSSVLHFLHEETDKWSPQVSRRTEEFATLLDSLLRWRMHKCILAQKRFEISWIVAGFFFRFLGCWFCKTPFNMTEFFQRVLLGAIRKGLKRGRARPEWALWGVHWVRATPCWDTPTPFTPLTSPLACRTTF